MKIKELIDTTYIIEDITSGSHGLHIEDTIYAALDLFVKLKIRVLPVYENGVYAGALKMTAVVKVMRISLQIERDFRYQ